MPYTINGIGNSYYGKQRIHSIHGTCEFCGNMTVLKSYDTVNYIVVIYIPIIPLGSLRILGECSSCNKFRCMPLKQWEASKRKAIDAMKVELASDDDSTLPVKKAIGVAIGYQDMPLLDNVANTFGKSMSDDNEVQELLGDAFVYFGRHKDATLAFKNSLGSKPDELVSDRLALAYMRSGEPAAATPHAEQALASGDANRLWVPQLLISSFQGVNDHDQAKSWLSKIESAAPTFVSTKPFQELKKSVEKGLKKGKPIKDPFLSNQGIEVAQTNQRKFSIYYVVGPVILAALLALYLGSAIYKGANQRVIIVNAIPAAYDVTIGGKKVSLSTMSRKELTLGQGEWDIVPSPDNKVKIKPAKFTIKTSFFMRPFSSPIFLVNPDQLGVFVREKTYYAENPASAPQGEVELLAGKSAYEFPSTNHVFEPFPEQIKIKGGSTSRTRIGQERIENGEITKILGVAMNPDFGIDLFDYLESRIEHFGDSDYLVAFLAKTAPPERFLAFVTQHLNDQPVRVGLHREYQNAMRNADKLQPLLDEYRERLSSEPKSLDWIFLLARITEDEDQAERLWSQLVQNPRGSDAVQLGCAARWFSQGEFKEAAKMASDLPPNLPNQPLAKLQRLSYLEAAKQYDKVIELCKEIPEPFSDTAVQFGVRAVHAMNPKNSQSATTDFINGLPSLRNAFAQPGLPNIFFDDKQKAVLKAYAAYANKDIALFEKAIRETVEFNELELDAVIDNYAPYLKKDDPENGAELRWVDAATLALSAHRKGDIPARDSFVADCIKSLASSDYFERKLAVLLSSDQKIDIQVFRKLPISPGEKCLAATVLMLRKPEQSAELAELARLFNYEKSPPYWLIHDVVEANGK
jgi:tetratricopeptide (TPR) repeat protein